MQNWEYLTVQVCLDARSSTYLVTCKGEQCNEEEHSLSDFLLDMGKQGWEYVELNNNVVTLRRPQQ